MDLALNVDVHCNDGRCGRSTHIILNPATDTATHLVVAGRPPARTERLVPIEWIEQTTPELILLSCSLDEFEQLEQFRQTDFVYTNLYSERVQRSADPELTLMWPYVVPAKRVIGDDVRRIPPGELAVRRGARVRARDGRVGRVDEFVVDPEDGQITHLVLRESHLWGQRDVCVPISYISRIEEDIVQLDLDRAEVESLPTLRLRRRW